MSDDQEGPERGGWFTRLHREWTKNDGKPWEELEQERDLKETGLVIAALVCGVGMVALTVWSLLR